MLRQLNISKYQEQRRAVQEMSNAECIPDRCTIAVSAAYQLHRLKIPKLDSSNSSTYFSY